MEDGGPFGPMQEPTLDEDFVRGARHVEQSHREREVDGQRRQAAERAARLAAERERAKAQPHRGWRRLPFRPPPATPVPDRRMRRSRTVRVVVLFVVFALVIAIAVLPGRFGHGRAAQTAVPVAVSTCPASTYPPSAQYRFEDCSGGQPVTWARCSRVSVAIDPDGAPATWRADTADALDQLGQATGLDLSPVSSGPADITIGWTAAVLQDGGQAAVDAAGLTDFEISRSPSSATLASARIQIRTGIPTPETPGGEVPVLLHELGHAVGMGHFPGPEVMNPTDQGFARYQAGDRAGLAAAYQPASCG